MPDTKSLCLGKIWELYFALAVCDAKIRDVTQEGRVDVVSVELREPDPRDLRSLRPAGLLVADV